MGNLSIIIIPIITTIFTISFLRKAPLHKIIWIIHILYYLITLLNQSFKLINYINLIFKIIKYN